MAQDRMSKEAIASVFTRTSASHDSVGTPLFAHFGPLLADAAELRAGDHVLDVAAGTGASLFPALDRVGDPGRVVGVDLADGMIERLREKIAARGITNAEAQVADAEELPFADASFDAVLCGFALFFFPRPVTALREFRRVLRPGGRVALTTFTRDGSASFDQTWARISSFVEGPPPPGDDEVDFDEPGQLVDVLQEAGFGAVEIAESPLTVVLPDADAWWAWLWSFEFGEYLERMGPETQAAFRASAAADFAKRPGAPEIRITMDALITTGRKP